jgi:hypothetical protein
MDDLPTLLARYEGRRIDFNLARRMRCSVRNDSSAGCDGSKGATAGTCDGPKGWNSSTVRCEGRRLRSRQDLNPEQEH